MTSPAEEEIDLRVTKDEALVLFAWLSRLENRTDEYDGLIQDQAEQRAIWNLVCVLEKADMYPAEADYHQALQEARDRLRDPDE